MSREERKQEELKRRMVYVGAGKAAGHTAILSTRPINVGPPKRILNSASFARLDEEDAPESYQAGLEAWRMVFLLKFPAVFCIVELTGGSLQ
jgi:hypothetical protein